MMITHRERDNCKLYNIVVLSILQTLYDLLYNRRYNLYCKQMQKKHKRIRKTCSLFLFYISLHHQLSHKTTQPEFYLNTTTVIYGKSTIQIIYIMKNQLGSILIALGIALAGYFVSLGLESFSAKDRIVTAKGLSERMVLADKAVWNISFGISGNSIEQLYTRLEPKQQAIVRFLKENGISDDEIIYSPSTATDRSTWYDWDKKRGVLDQYELTGHMTIVSRDVEKVRQLQLRQLDLIRVGVVLDNNYITYEYTGLNELKPEMVAEATVNARIVASKFADDANAKLGSLKSARQGQFEIESDEVMPHMRKVRVVTTMEYYLK